MELLSSISSIIPRYNAFFLDLWGVVHDGTHLYPGVRETLAVIKKTGKPVIFISNAPRRASRVASVLADLGIDNSLYDHVVSSGEAGFNYLKEGNFPMGRRYYLISAEKDVGLLDGLDYQHVHDLNEADFILNLGFGTEEQTTEDFAPVLNSAVKLSLPMLCLNPDLEVIKITGERYPCAGAIAKSYVALGGKVKWFGKPHLAIYEHAYNLLDGMDKKQILAVGDSLETDIPGAKAFAVDSALITGGILKGNNIDEIKEMCFSLGLRPNYLLPKFGI
ncbi:MAG: TIGR01459 family HAD-type hydrolase [Rickettsiales bacterium]